MGHGHGHGHEFIFRYGLTGQAVLPPDLALNK